MTSAYDQRCAVNRQGRERRDADRAPPPFFLQTKQQVESRVRGRKAMLTVHGITVPGEGKTPLLHFLLLVGTAAHGLVTTPPMVRESAHVLLIQALTLVLIFRWYLMSFTCTYKCCVRRI